MKKIYSFVAFILLAVGIASAQCTIDQNSTDLFNPNPDNVPCAEVGVAYDQTLQFHVPVSRDITIVGQAVTVFIDSVILNTVTGLPAGLNWSANPVGPLYLPDAHGCGKTFRTTTAAVGNYPISFDGRIYMHGSAFGFTVDTSFIIDQLIQQEYGKTFSIDVIAQGAVCHGGTGINDFNNELNTAISVYPNPSNGIFEFRLNAGGRVAGDLNVIDVTGRIVHTTKVDVMGLYNSTINLSQFAKGLYTIQLKTANGFASKSISVE